MCNMLLIDIVPHSIACCCSFGTIACGRGHTMGREHRAQSEHIAFGTTVRATAVQRSLGSATQRFQNRFPWPRSGYKIAWVAAMPPKVKRPRLASLQGLGWRTDSALAKILRRSLENHPAQPPIKNNRRVPLPPAPTSQITSCAAPPPPPPPPFGMVL